MDFDKLEQCDKDGLEECILIVTEERGIEMVKAKEMYDSMQQK